MAKTDSKAVSFRLKSEVIWALEDLVGAWGTTQTGAVEKAILEARKREGGGASTSSQNPSTFEGSGSESSKSSEEAFEGAFSKHPDDIPGVQARCVHCGQNFEIVPGAPATSICRGCRAKGHRSGTDCGKCAEDAYFAKKRAESSAGDDPNVEFNVDWGA